MMGHWVAGHDELAPQRSRRRLFVIDGSKALRKAIDQVYGSGNPVQRCRNHKMRNVLRHLPLASPRRPVVQVRAFARG